MKEKDMKKYDTGQGSGVTKDVFAWRLRMKVPPVKYKKRPDKEEFEKLLKIQTMIRTPMMSKDEFEECLSEPEKYGRRRRYRSAKEAKINALEWYSKQEDNWWTNEQMKILIYLDRTTQTFKEAQYKSWQKRFIKECKKIYKNLLKEKKDKLAKEFIEEAYNRLESAKPRQRTEVEQVIITRIRRLTLQRRYFELNALAEELRPMIEAMESAT